MKHRDVKSEKPGDKPHQTDSAATAFSRRLIKQHEQPLIADVYGLLRSLLAYEFTDGELPGLRQSLIYKEPDRTVHQSIYSSYIESVLSLTVNKLTQYFDVWLHQPYIIQMLAKLESNFHFASRTHSQLILESGRVKQSARALRAPAAPLEVFRLIETVVKLADATTGSMRAVAERKEMAATLGVDSPFVMTADSRELVFVQAKTRPESSIEAATRRGFSEPGFVKAGQQRTADDFVKPSLAPMAVALAARDMAAKIERFYFNSPITASPPGYKMVPLTAQSKADNQPFAGEALAWRSPVGAPDQAGQSVALRTFSESPERQAKATRMNDGPRWPETLTKIERWFERNQENRLLFTTVKSTSMPPATSVLLSVAGDEAAPDFREAALAPLVNRDWIIRTMAMPETVNQEPGVESRFTFLRREERLPAPLQSLAFAQPARPVIEEEPSVKRVREKEVVEVVKKEVETQMKSRSLIDGLSRSDYSQIAEQVYSSLARRLVMERERTGLRS